MSAHHQQSGDRRGWQAGKRLCVAVATNRQPSPKPPKLPAAPPSTLDSVGSRCRIRLHDPPAPPAAGRDASAASIAGGRRHPAAPPRSNEKKIRRKKRVVTDRWVPRWRDDWVTVAEATSPAAGWLLRPRADAGVTCILKIGFPTLPRERRVAEVVKNNVKDNKEYRDPPEEGLPQPAPQQNVEEEDLSLKQYYQIGISSMEDHIASVGRKVADVIRDPDTSPADSKKIARKLGRGQKFLESVKANVTCLEEVEAAQELMEIPALEEQGAALLTPRSMV